MLNIISLGNYYAEYAANDTVLTNLRPLVKELCRERFRRIDRFIQLALLGSASAIKAYDIAPNTALYLASSQGAINTTCEVHKQIFLQHQLPKITNFINTLSNSACFYVASNLQLQGQTQFISRGSASLEAALQMATLELELGNVEQVLVGMVDEATMPLAHNAKRLGISANTLQAEGSHWFLLTKSALYNAKAQLTHLACLPDIEHLNEWLVSMDDVSHYYLAPKCQEISHTTLSRAIPYVPKLGYYPARTAGALLNFIANNVGQSLLTISEDSEARFHLIRVDIASCS